VSGFARELRLRLDACIADVGIPGSSIAVYHAGAWDEVTAGILNIRTAVPVTPDAVFMIGSVTKTITASLMMQLVDEGRVDLENPAVRYLPEVEIEGVPLPEEITVRRLLNHTSGIDGDFFIDTGRNDDALELYMSELGRTRYLHPPGRMRAYNNAAYGMVGRIIEKLIGEPFHRIFRERALLPLGIEDSVLRPEEFLRYRSAVGHTQDSETGGVRVADPLIGELNHLPAGTLVSMSARSLATFGQMIVDRGMSIDGNRIVSEAGLEAMERPLTGVVPEVHRSHVWECENLGDARLLSHFGGTCGQNSWLGVVSERELVVAVLTNFFSGAFSVLQEIVPWILTEKIGLELPPHEVEEPESPPAIDLEPLVGSYHRFAMDVEITRDNDGLRVSVDDHEHELDLGPEPSYPLRPLTPTSFLIEGQQLLPSEPLTVQFFSWDDWPSPVLVYFGRAHLRES